MAIPVCRNLHDYIHHHGHAAAEERFQFSVLKVIIAMLAFWILRHDGEEPDELIVEFLHEHVTKTQCRIPKALRRSSEKNSGT